MITEKINKLIVEAMKTKDAVRLSTLKLLSSALHNAEIDKKRVSLTKEEELAVVKREAKKRKDAIEMYKRGGAEDRAKKEQQELSILEEFLPEQISNLEIERVVNAVVSEVGAESLQDIGKVMGPIMGKLKGQADGVRVSAIVKKKLGK